MGLMPHAAKLRRHATDIQPQVKTIKMAGLLKRSFLTLAHSSSGLFDMPSSPKRVDSQDEQLDTRPNSTAPLAPSSMTTMFSQPTFPPQRLSPQSLVSTHMPSYHNHPQSSPYFNEPHYYNDTGGDFSNVPNYGSTYTDPFWQSSDMTTSYTTGSPASSTPSSMVSEAYNFSQPSSNYSLGWTGSQPDLPSSGRQAPGMVYRATSYPQPSTSHSYSTTRYHPYANRISPSGSSELVLSPHPGPGLGLSPRVSSPMSLTSNVGGEDDKGLGLLSVATPSTTNKPLYTHREQLQFFKEAISLPGPPLVGPFIPQVMYKPHTNSDRRRYVEEIDLDAPIYFWSENPNECGISLTDALHSRVKGLSNRDETVFEGRGPSVSIRLEWPGYRQWSRQIPTRDFRSPPGPITKAKLAKNVARCVQRFFADRQGHPLEDDSDARWRIGSGPGLDHIRFEDLILVSIHHVSMGSWQPQLRLSRPFPPALSSEEF